MANASETIEKLTRKLERERFCNELNACETLEDFQALRKKYNDLTEADRREEP